MNKIKLFITKFKEKNPEYINKEVNFYTFGSEAEMANDLAKLVFSGEKCGTTSLYQLYELENERIPQVDDLNVIIDGKGNPICLIINTEIEILKFRDITEQHAFIEGEGDKSLNYWRDAHIAFFTDSYQENKEVKFDEDSLVVFETFKVIYRGAE